jgi:hypothetical protein
MWFAGQSDKDALVRSMMILCGNVFGEQIGVANFKFATFNFSQWIRSAERQDFSEKCQLMQDGNCLSVCQPLVEQRFLFSRMKAGRPAA